MSIAMRASEWIASLAVWPLCLVLHIIKAAIRSGMSPASDDGGSGIITNPWN